ncbi:MAG: GHMP kinase, partial [Halarsenatibacteraceae bacterium]
KKILNYYQVFNTGLDIDIASELLIGKGMGSSTADLAATVAAIMLLFKEKIDYYLLKKILIEVEPSDSSFLPGLHLLDHLKGSKLEYLGRPPDLEIMIFIQPGIIETNWFNQQENLKTLKTAKEVKVKKAFHLIKKGIKEQNKVLIGQGATLSSLAHQQILPKKGLERIKEIIIKTEKIYGMNIAHSGSLLGLLVEPGFNNNLIKNQIESISQFKFYKKVSIVGGGVEKVNIKENIYV